MKRNNPAAGSSDWMTIADLARMAGVSQSTISRALADNPLISEKTRHRVQALAQETGFTLNPIASSLRSKQSRIISVVIAVGHERNHHHYGQFWMTMLAHLADALHQAGYDMLLSKVSVHEEAWFDRIRNAQRPAGMILIGQSQRHPAIEAAARAGQPIVVWGPSDAGQSYMSVGSDNHGGGLLATRHLLSLGHRRVMFLGDATLPEIAQRHKGYCAALAEVGLAADPNLLVASGFDAEQALEAANAAIQRGLRFDAIFAASDVIAVSAIRALGAAGRQVPQDVSVAGFDDIPMAAYSNPPLTTVRQNIAEGARLLVRALSDSIAGRTPSPLELPAELVVRQSTGPAKSVH